jgi:hypothetical protein
VNKQMPNSALSRGERNPSANSSRNSIGVRVVFYTCWKTIRLSSQTQSDWWIAQSPCHASTQI